MRRVLLSLSLTTAILATRTEAQQVYFSSPIGDTVLSALTGDTGIVQLWLSAAGGVSAYDLTIFFDDARVHFVRADSAPSTGMPSPTVAIGSDQVNLTASGTGTTSSSPLLATLYFEMDAAAQTGSCLSLKLNTFTAGDGSTDLLPTLRTNIWDVCQAEQVWGDLDANRVVNSRDALVAITSAVGLPVSGFDVAMGDVDRDSVTTTRDALLILSYGIGLNTYTVAGRARANSCPPLEPWPSDVAMWTTGGLSYFTAGDTLLQTVPIVGAQTNYLPSWAPDGSRLLVVKYIGTPYYYYDLVTTTLDGLEEDTLFVSPSVAEYAPAWSPDGTKIAFLRYQSPLYSLFVMNADGTNQVQLTGKSFADSININTNGGIAWSPDGSKIAFSGQHATIGGNNIVWTINADGTAPDSVTSVNGSYPVFSPVGDSIAYYYPSLARIYVIQAAGDTGLVGGAASSLAGIQNYPLWLSGGMAFRSSVRSPNEFYLHTPNGRDLRLTRDLQNGNYASARYSSIYVDTVTVTPAVDSIAVLGDSTTLSAAVRNSDGSASSAVITWRSRDTTIATVDSVTGVVIAADSGDVYILGTAGGWRSDSALVRVVSPPAAPPATAEAGRRR